MKIAYKESEETKYWLELCRITPAYPIVPVNLFEEIDSIQRILGKIIVTSKS
jgi:hypothetical protein